MENIWLSSRLQLTFSSLMKKSVHARERETEGGQKFYKYSRKLLLVLIKQLGDSHSHILKKNPSPSAKPHAKSDL